MLAWRRNFGRKMSLGDEIDVEKKLQSQKLSLDNVACENAAAVAELLAYVGKNNDFGTYYDRVQMSCLYLLVRQLHANLHNK